MLLRLFNLLRGFLVIEVQGLFLERFINICIRRNILLWDIKKTSRDKLCAKISMAGFHHVRDIARKTGSHPRILEKRGLPMLIHHYRRRTAFLAGIAVCAAALAFLSSFVWVVDITGNEKIPTEEIRIYLKACGLSEGVIKYNLNSAVIKDQMLIKMDALSWLWVEIRGTKAYVNVRERRKPPERIDASVSCNIVAERDGVIKKMIVRSGQPMVREGDAVTEGQLIVSGVMESIVMSARTVHSDAEITASTWRQKSEVVPLSKEVRTPTGRTKSRYSLSIFQNTLNLWLDKDAPYDNYDIEEQIFTLKLWGEVYLPLSMKMNNYIEITAQREPISKDEASQAAAARMEKLLTDSFFDDVYVVNKEMHVEDLGNDIINVKLVLECVEELGVKVTLDKEEQVDRENDST